jgi:hypothetical protein
LKKCVASAGHFQFAGAAGTVTLDLPLDVMAGLDPAIHVFVSREGKQDVDHRVIGERKRRRSSNGYAR